MKTTRIFFLLFVACLLSTSCATLGIGSIRTKYISQYVGDEGIQYFIKPITFEADNGSTLSADFTFRHGELNINDTVLVNYTIRSKQKEARLNRFGLCFGNQEKEAISTKTLYKERDKYFVTRYSSIFRYNQLRAAFKNQSFKLKTVVGDKEVLYRPTKSSEQLIHALDESIFQMLD